MLRNDFHVQSGGSTQPSSWEGRFQPCCRRRDSRGRRNDEAFEQRVPEELFIRAITPPALWKMGLRSGWFEAALEGEIQKRMDSEDVEIGPADLESYRVWSTEKWSFWKDSGFGEKVSFVSDV